MIDRGTTYHATLTVTGDDGAPVNPTVATLTITLPDGTRKTLTGKELVKWKYQRYMQDYLACVQGVDDSVGEVLDYLDRSGLAANTIAGGRAAEEQEESRWKNAEQEVRSAQSQWTRLGPVPPDVAGPLNERFQRACRKFYDSRRAPVGAR